MAKRGGRVIAAAQALQERMQREELEREANKTPPPPISMPPALLVKTKAPENEPPPAPIMPAPDVYPGANGELQQTATSDSLSGLGYETNMAAFEAQDPRGSGPAKGNVGYASFKAGLRR